MKRKPFALLLISGIVFYFTLSNAQEGNYINSKYDFIPGEKMIFFDDFAFESIGDFPAQWLTNGSGEIVTSDKFPGRWFHMTKMGYFIPEAKEDFTENFTIEFDFIPQTTDNSEFIRGFVFYLLTGSLSEPGAGGEPGDAGFLIYLGDSNLSWKNWSLQNEQRFNGEVAYTFKANEKYHIAIWVQKQRVRLYADENKILDVPRAIPAGSKPNIFRLESDQVSIPLISNFRIATGLPDLRNRLLTDGKIISYGIQFDVNSDNLKPESYSILKIIADLLNEDPTLKLEVVGHTDSDGDDASNLDLSKRRAASVKNELANKFGVEAARLEIDGKGETEPFSDNNSVIGKAKNRRVEFIDLKTVNSPISTTGNLAIQEGKTQLLDVDGTNYKTVLIGTQIWMAENLQTTKYNDGTSIPLYTDSTKWSYIETPGYCWYRNDEKTYKLYGPLYNWYAVNTGKLCPTGWHVPTEADWSELSSYLNDSGDAGGKLKEKGTTHWKAPNTGATNETGFTALPGGGCEDSGEFHSMFIEPVGIAGSWWSSTESNTKTIPPSNEPETNANNRAMKNSDDGLYGGTYPKGYGMSVRCIKN
jgi:OOP family OmpA-OmpF porin